MRCSAGAAAASTTRTRIHSCATNAIGSSSRHALDLCTESAVALRSYANTAITNEKERESAMDQVLNNGALLRQTFDNIVLPHGTMRGLGKFAWRNRLHCIFLTSAD